MTIPFDWFVSFEDLVQLLIKNLLIFDRVRSKFISCRTTHIGHAFPIEFHSSYVCMTHLTIKKEREEDVNEENEETPQQQ